MGKLTKNSLILGFAFFLIVVAVWWVKGTNQTTNINESSTVIKIGDANITAEVMDTPELRARGLSGRKSLPADRGMLFVFSKEDNPGFWMKEMNFSIDIIWIGADKKVVDLTPDLQPSTYPQTFYSRFPAQYALEVNAGWAKEQNVSIGQPVSFVGGLKVQ